MRPSRASRARGPSRSFQEGDRESQAREGDPASCSPADVCQRCTEGASSVPLTRGQAGLICSFYGSWDPAWKRLGQRHRKAQGGSSLCALSSRLPRPCHPSTRHPAHATGHLGPAFPLESVSFPLIFKVIQVLCFLKKEIIRKYKGKILKTLKCNHLYLTSP